MKTNGIECIFLVTGTGFIEGEHYILVLAESSESNADPVTLEFEIVMSSSTEGESATIELGKEDSLQFGTTYPIVKLHLFSDSSLAASTPPTLTTPSTHGLPILYVDGEVASDDSDCRTPATPCQTVDRALRITKAALFVDVSILVTRAPVLSQSFEMQNGITLIVKKAGEFAESVRIPSSSDSSSPLLTLTGGRLKLDPLSFAFEHTSPSFCLISSTNTKIELENVQMTGPTLPTTSTINEEIDDMSRWQTGLLKAKGGVITASECHFSQIRQGVFSVDGSNVTLSFCKQSANTPRPSLFPSLQWNVRCVGSGEVILETENSETSQQESHWISTSECSVSVNGQKSLSPFVVPTLSVSDCSVSQKKSKDPLTIRIVGTKLIPCGLSFEIFETADSKSKSNSKLNTATPYRVSLTDPSVSSASETEVLISVLESSTQLEKSSRWDGRIIFGDEQATQSFTVKMSAKEKMALGADKIVPWLVPLIVSLVVLSLLVIIVVVLLRRRKQKEKMEQQNELKEQEASLEDDKMDVVVSDHQLSANPNNSLESHPSDIVTNMAVVLESKIDGEETIEALLCVDGVKLILAKKKDTLYNRLHSKDRQEVMKRVIQRQIVTGLKTIAQKTHEAAILTALPSRNIRLDECERVCFKTNTDIVKPSANQSQLQNASLPNMKVEGDNPEVNEQEHLNNDRKKDPATESQRWLAPEVAGKKPNVVGSQASVFSLGLILWEIETGQVPYGEQDGANAARQIAAGVPPDLSQVKNTEMKELIEMCLALNPKDRPQLADIETSLNAIEDASEEQPKPSIDG
ncbi:hypothetical protein BLNAU_11359 [Blattamonas nauphoetae]|uniref:Protein kinase domain-containing protein n=1 Tax=Blattamonas nauphoetae TaxID=2049346 RepID=A0ABQ9XMJ3_9EUKA|nr:hypothetical protein BLNAU_11359 [Blattamonas nauphoetae]